MDKKPALIGLEHIEEHEDGSATYRVRMDNRSRDMLVEEAFTLILYCAAAKVDLQDVYDWIMSQVKNDGD